LDTWSFVPKIVDDSHFNEWRPIHIQDTWHCIENVQFLRRSPKALCACFNKCDRFVALQTVSDESHSHWTLTLIQCE
jgi:hypothetical protein